MTPEPAQPAKSPEARALPCPNPWCASHADEAVPNGDDVWQHPALSPLYRVQCAYCPIKGPTADTEQKAVAAWNTRAATTARPTERGAVEAISVRLLSEMRRVARQDGWSLAVHGSMARDLDIIAVPWTDAATDETAFVEAMRAAVARELSGKAFIGAGNDGRTAGHEDKPHGRRCWTIHAISDQLVESERGAHPYVDLAIMDFRALAATDQAAEVEHYRAALERIAKGTTVHLEGGEAWPSPLGARNSQEIARRALATQPATGRTMGGEAPSEDWLAEVLDDSLDMDWTGRVGAQAIIREWDRRYVD